MALEIADWSKCPCYCWENIWRWNLEQQKGCALGGLQSFIPSILYGMCSNFISLFVWEIKIIKLSSPITVQEKNLSKEGHNFIIVCSPHSLSI